MSRAIIYWKKKVIKTGNACPNVSLFRLLNDLNFNYKRKKVLELGFGHGADIIEFKKRGSEVYGIDINKNAVQDLKSKLKIKNLKINDCSDQKKFFGNTKFDLIYNRDFIYYFSNNKIKKLKKNVYNNLKLNGLYIFQYIENDMQIDDLKSETTEIGGNLFKKYKNKKFSEKDNPVRFLKFRNLYNVALKIGFKYLGKKLLIESYGINEEKLRINRYLIFCKKF